MAFVTDIGALARLSVVAGALALAGVVYSASSSETEQPGQYGAAQAAPSSAAAAVAQAVAAADRPDGERARDAGRRPAQVLAFMGVVPGMTVYEVGSGGGYYTDLLSRVVGPNGKVYAQYSERAWERFKEPFAERFAAGGNVVPYVGESSKFDGADNSVDEMMVALIWHHMHYNADDGEALPAMTKAFLANTMRVLKPGGVLLIVEHQAAEGSTREQSAAWHRTPKQMTIDDVTSAGFEFAGSSDALANPDDDLQNYWREALPERDSSQRFILKFVKPAA